MLDMGMLCTTDTPIEFQCFSGSIFPSSLFTRRRGALGDICGVCRSVENYWLDANEPPPGGYIDLLPIDRVGHVGLLLGDDGHKCNCRQPGHVVWGDRLSDGVTCMVDTYKGANRPWDGIMAEPSGNVQQNVYKILANLDVQTERILDIQTSAKRRDEKLETILDIVRTHGQEIQALSVRSDTAIVAAKEEALKHYQIVTGQVSLVDQHLRTIDLQIASVLTDVGKLKGDTSGIQTQVKNLSTEVVGLKESVTPIINLRRHVFAIGAMIASVFGVIWYAVQPLVTWIINYELGKFFPGHN